jgi:hypothetical protein
MTYKWYRRTQFANDNLFNRKVNPDGSISPLKKPEPREPTPDELEFEAMTPEEKFWRNNSRD